MVSFPQVSPPIYINKYIYIQFTYTLNDAMRSSKYAIKWNEYYGIIIWKEWRNLSYVSIVWLEALGKPRQMSKQRPQCRDENQRYPEYETGVSPTQPYELRCEMCICFIILFPDHIIWYLPSQLLGVLSRLQSIINFEYRDSITRTYYNESKPEVL